MRIPGIFVILLTLSMPCIASSERVLPRGYVCCRAGGRIKIDGRLNDKAWRRAPWTEYHADIEGFGKPEPRLHTRSKMLWDDKYLYIGAYLEEPHVWANLTKHDSVIFKDNDFEIFMDPDGNCHSYYEIEINARNTEWDLYLPKPYKDKGSALDEFELPGIKHATHVFGTINNPSDVDKGWSVEYAIPWAALAQHANVSCPPKEGDRWRIDFSRVEWTTDVIKNVYVKRKGLKEDNWIWSPQGVVDMHRPETWGFVQFTYGRPGTVKFRRAPDYAARMYLIQIYYAQNAFYRKYNRWASVKELGWAARDSRFEGSLRLEPGSLGFKASVQSRTDSAKRVCIGQDSRFWFEQGSH